MKIRFWGVRGSVSTALTARQVQAKITAVVQRITPRDIESEDARERFLARLPAWIFGTVGGNTPCVQLTSENGVEFILDAGSGIRVLGKNTVQGDNLHFNLFFSHFHWDHIQGLPFFDPIYNSSTSFDVYSAFPAAYRILNQQMQPPYFPVTWDAFTKNIRFHTVVPGEPFSIGGIKICCCKMSHPGNSYSFSFEENGKKFVYATDVELLPSDFKQNDEKKAIVFNDADVLVFDAQYTAEEASLKENWGHSAFCSAVDFAATRHAKQLYLFHHEPVYDDKKVDSILQTARWYADYITHNNIKIFLASEGQEIDL